MSPQQERKKVEVGNGDFLFFKKKKKKKKKEKARYYLFCPNHHPTDAAALVVVLFRSIIYVSFKDGSFVFFFFGCFLFRRTLMKVHLLKVRLFKVFVVFFLKKRPSFLIICFDVGRGFGLKDGGGYALVERVPWGSVSFEGSSCGRWFVVAVGVVDGFSRFSAGRNDEGRWPLAGLEFLLAEGRRRREALAGEGH